MKRSYGKCSRCGHPGTADEPLPPSGIWRQRIPDTMERAQLALRRWQRTPSRPVE